MKKTLTRHTLEEILDDAGLDPEDVVYNWPSGMYGGYGRHNSFALTADDYQMAQFYMALGSLITYATYVDKDRSYPEGFANLKELLPSGVDSLGKGTVTYFRGWELEPEPEDDA
jgi:hypothetical protein